MTPNSTFVNNQKGAAVVEFALVLPLLLLFIFGAIEFGLLLYNKQVITNTAREGCRVGVVMRVETDDSSGTPVVVDRTVATEDQYIIDKINSVMVGLVTFGSDTFDPTFNDPTTDHVVIQAYIDSGTPWVRKLDPNNTDTFKFGTNLTVKVIFSYDFLFLSTIGIGPIGLESIATMRME